MKKEEILELSRSEKIDEGEDFADNKARYYGVLVVFLCFSAMYLLDIFFGEGVDYMLSANILLFAFLGTSSLSYYKHSNKKISLMCFFLSSTMAFFSFVEFAFLLIWDLDFIEFLFRGI